MQKENRLYVACIVSLVATSFGFITRALLLNDLAGAFDLTETQKGALQGAGLYPFALSIIFFSLIVDRIGYKRAMYFAWGAHVISAIITITAPNFAVLYAGTLLFALANGTVEAVINPVTATLFPKSKTHHLSILHAGWPGGLVLGGIVVILLSGINGENAWRLKIGLFIIPAIIYGIMMFKMEFPVQERAAAGVSYQDMLKEFGWLGFYIVSVFIFLAFDEIVRALAPGKSFLPENWPWIAALLWALLPTVLFAIFGKIITPGRPLFIFLMLVMICLATTELGTDSWISDLLTPALADISVHAGSLVLIYTSAIMLILRFFGGPIAKRLGGPLGLLAASAFVATIGLLWLANAGAVAWVVFLAATCYGLGKTFFWPATLGVVSEQFPKGGALTINAIAGMGMISVGVLGNPFLGAIQDKSMDTALSEKAPALYEQVTGEEEMKYGMSYQPVMEDKVASLSEEQRQELESLRSKNKQATLAKVAILPAIMLVCYICLIIYFKSKGGYKQVELELQQTDEGTGVEGPVE